MRAYRASATRLALLLLPLPALALAAGGLAARSPTPGEALALTGSPTEGVAPLLVQFQLTEPNGTAPALSWDFGDGGYLNGSSRADYAPLHEYVRPGAYTCTVAIRWPTGTVNDSLAIRVRSSNLSVTASASPESGPAPLTVWFNATVAGGSGTYLSYAWSFGDGDQGSGLSVRYTYEHPGRYTANFTATDSLGTAGSASVNVAVGPSGASGGPASGGASDPTISITLPVAGAIVAAAAAIALVTYAGARRFRVPPAGPVRPAPAAVAVPRTPPAPPAPPAEVPAPPALPAPPDGAPRPPPARPDGGPLTSPSRITDELLRYLAGLPTLWSNDLPTKAWTQAGIAEAVGAGQSAVSRVLRRLVAAGVVTVETRHVEGSARRLRIYRLTPRGERLGRALREIRPEPEAGAPTAPSTSRSR